MAHSRAFPRGRQDMPKLESEEKTADRTDSARTEHGSDDDRRHLEKLVADRTRELADANAELQLRIRELRQGERAWRESEERYRELADLLPLVVLETDEKGTLTVRAQVEQLCLRPGLATARAFQMKNV